MVSTEPIPAITSVRAKMVMYSEFPISRYWAMSNP